MKGRKKDMRYQRAALIYRSRADVSRQQALYEGGFTLEESQKKNKQTYLSFLAKGAKAEGEHRSGGTDTKDTWDSLSNVPSDSSTSTGSICSTDSDETNHRATAPRRPSADAPVSLPNEDCILLGELEQEHTPTREWKRLVSRYARQNDQWSEELYNKILQHFQGHSFLALGNDEVSWRYATSKEIRKHHKQIFQQGGRLERRNSKRVTTAPPDSPLYNPGDHGGPNVGDNILAFDEVWKAKVLEVHRDRSGAVSSLRVHWKGFEGPGAEAWISSERILPDSDEIQYLHRMTLKRHPDVARPTAESGDAVPFEPSGEADAVLNLPENHPEPTQHPRPLSSQEVESTGLFAKENHKTAKGDIAAKENTNQTKKRRKKLRFDSTFQSKQSRRTTIPELEDSDDDVAPNPPPKRRRFKPLPTLKRRIKSGSRTDNHEPTRETTADPEDDDDEKTRNRLEFRHSKPPDAFNENRFEVASATLKCPEKMSVAQRRSSGETLIKQEDIEEDEIPTFPSQSSPIPFSNRRLLGIAVKEEEQQEEEVPSPALIEPTIAPIPRKRRSSSTSENSSHAGESRIGSAFGKEEFYGEQALPKKRQHQKHQPNMLAKEHAPASGHQDSSESSVESIEGTKPNGNDLLVTGLFKCGLGAFQDGTPSGNEIFHSIAGGSSSGGVMSPRSQLASKTCNTDVEHNACSTASALDPSRESVTETRTAGRWQMKVTTRPNQALNLEANGYGESNDSSGTRKEKKPKRKPRPWEQFGSKAKEL